jgi:DNA topoisomerase II
MPYQFISPEDAIRRTDWAAGPRTVEESVELVVVDGKVSMAKTPCIPALFKIFDEIVVNALDQWARGVSPPVKNIWIELVAGRLSVRNDGKGIPIHMEDVPQLGGKIWFPTIVFSAFNQTTNIQSSSITGGVNGLGAKITAVYSTEFTLKTRTGGLYFEQTWKDGKKTALPPIVREDVGGDFTEITFIPDYAGVFGGANPQDFAPIAHGRARLAALYTEANVYYNGEKLPADTPTLLRECNPAEVYKIDLPDSTYPWTVYVQVGGFKLSIVNGIVVKGGPHMTFFENMLTEEIGARIGKKIKSSEKIKKAAICGHLGYILIAQIPSPSWTGQRKDILSGNVSKFAGRKAPARQLDALSKAVEAYVLETILGKKRAKREDIDKYYPAEKLGANSVLYCVEGDSAMSQVKTAITNNSHLTFKRSGLFSLGGVIVNVRKELTFVYTASGRMANQSDKLKKNKRISAFLKATGLRYDYTYETPEQRKTLKYQFIRLVPDQDFDGKGKILSLVTSFIHYCWPALLCRPSYVQWQQSPIIWAYPKQGVVKAFYSIDSFNKWDSTGYEIKYCKGMASYSPDETIHMFKAPPIYELFTDERSGELFEIYLGDDPKKRRRVLTAPTTLEEITPIQSGISCSDHLLCEADHFQRDDLLRKLDNYIDGCTQSARKILDGCLEQFTNTKPKKIDSIAGYILEHKSYEHGVPSLSQSIIGKAALYRRQLPILLPDGMFGSRLNGGADAGAPRYISASLNMRLCSVLYPAEDYELLQFTFNEGKQGEPEYFIPIIPVAICETAELPSHGWKLQKWAMDALGVIDAVVGAIRGRKILTPLQYYRGNWTGEFRRSGGKTYSVGKYALNFPLLTITELPIGVWSDPWSKKYSDREDTDPIFYRVNDQGNTERDVCTKIYLHPNALALLAEYATGDFDGIEVYFSLREPMNNELNLFTEHLSVREFATYEDVLWAWFPHRKELYRKRLARRLLRGECRLALLREQEKFTGAKADFSTLREAEMIRRLEESGYPKLRSGQLKGRQFMSDAEFRERFYAGTYDYLLNMNARDKSHEASVRRQAKIAELVAATSAIAAELQAVFPARGEWLAELEELKQTIIEGRRTTWKFGDYAKHTF